MSFTQDMVAEIIDEEGADNLTAKTVRQKLEAKLGLESGALKSKKDDIAKMIDDVLNAVSTIHHHAFHVCNHAYN